IVEHLVPVIVVRTDEDVMSGVSSSGWPVDEPHSRDTTLIIEYSLTNARRNQSGDPIQQWPQADGKLEAMLDLLGYQIEDALFGWGQWARWWTNLWPLTHMRSAHLYTEPGQVKLTVREMLLTIRINQECYPKPLKEQDAEVETSGEPSVPVSLPAKLKAIFEKIATDGAGEIKDSFAELRADLEAQRLPRSDIYPMFERMRGVVPNIEDTPPTGEEHETLFKQELKAEVPGVAYE
ncbi:MAG: hypothetical protein L0287_32710, partial [Anaerolineae bacterium]|nr:hypothetical protein [Anaerolineae bacterium]